jgi:hypothetical protein
MRALQLAHAWDGWPRHPLHPDECEAIVDAVRSTFRKLGKLYREIEPAFVRYGFTPPSPGVMARDLSEKIEVAIAQHCEAFIKPSKEQKDHHDLRRAAEAWEIKTCHSGLTINQSATIRGEHYIVVNYAKGRVVPTQIWVLWEAQDAWFSSRKSNTNARRLILRNTPRQAIQRLYSVKAITTQDSWLPLPK